MSGLDSTMMPDSRAAELHLIGDHLRMAREAYERLKQEEANESYRLIPESDQTQEFILETLIKWLNEVGLTYTSSEGEHATSFFNALLQHASGSYNQSSFPETSTIISNQNYESSLQEEDIQEIVQVVNQAKRTNLLVCILIMTPSNQPRIVSEIGPSDGDPVLIWSMKEGKYSPIIPLALIENLSISPSSETQQSNSSASIFHSYTSELRSFKQHLYDLANPFIVKEILKAFSSLESISESERILPEVSDLPVETVEAIDSLNVEIYKLLNRNPDKLDPLKLRILGDLKSLMTDTSYEETVWEELIVLLNIPEIRRLPNNHVKKMKHYINKEDTERLREHVENTLRINSIDTEHINSYLVDTDYYDLETLLAEIIEKKPRIRDDLQYYWDKEEEFFINKNLCVIIPNPGVTINGLINKCARTDKANLNFKLNNNTEIEIIKSDTTSTAMIKYEGYLTLWSAIFENKIGSGKYEICTHSSIEECRPGMIEPGIYIIFEGVLKNTGPTVVRKYSKTIYIKKPKSKYAYQLTAIYASPESKYPTFEISLLNRNDNPKYTHQLIFSEFNRTYLTKIQDIREYPCDPSKDITINFDIDENQIKQKYRNEINNQIRSIKTEFNKEECSNLLDILLDNLIKNHLVKVDMEILHKYDRIDLYMKLEDISKIYKTRLRNERHPEDILKEIVVDVNYSRLIQKSKGLEISKAMELLKEAFNHIDDIKNQEIILFIGNTGSGKSTTINYLLGAELEYFHNQAGSQCVRVKPQASSEDLPIIGQSISESETIYTRGFKVKPQGSKTYPALITDCPGFKDTRGSNYELCTNLSIDQAIKHCATIKGIVIAVPIQAFLLDRSEPILNLIESVAERFEETFNPAFPEGNKRIFILITKSDQVAPEVVKGIRDGVRFRELCSEAERRCRNIAESKDSDQIELVEAERKLKIWQSLLSMHRDNQIDILDMKNKRKRNELLQKYNSSHQNINKESYSGLMKSRDMASKFGKCIEMSTHTWTHLIFKQYREAIPASIKESTDKIIQYRTKIEEADQDRKNRIEDLKKEQAFLQGQIENQSPNPEDSSIPSDISTEVAEKIKAEIKRLKVKILDTQEKLSSKVKEKSQSENRLKELNYKIKEINSQILDISEGCFIDELYSEDYREREHEMIKIYKDDERRAMNALDDLRELDETGQVESQKVAKNFSGSVIRVKVFEKSYRLVPQDAELREKFNKSFKASLGDTKYSVSVIGEGISDIKARNSPDGKKVAYYFKLNFSYEWDQIKCSQQTKMPWIKIIHEIPNFYYNEAAIINLNSVVNQMLKRESEIEDDIKTINQFGKQLEQKLAQFKAQKQELENQLQKLESKLAYLSLDMILKQIDADINALENSKDSEEEIVSYNNEILREEEKIKANMRRKKHLAIIIKTHIQSARLIREFTQIVKEGKERENIQTTYEIMKVCDEFIEEFDTNLELIEQEVEQDLEP